MPSTISLVPVLQGLQESTARWMLMTVLITRARIMLHVLIAQMAIPVSAQTATMEHFVKRRSTSASLARARTMEPARIRRLVTNANASTSIREKTAKTWLTSVYHRLAKMEVHVKLTTLQDTSHAYVKQVLPEQPVMWILTIVRQIPVCLTLIALIWWMIMNASAIHRTLGIAAISVSSEM